MNTTLLHGKPLDHMGAGRMGLSRHRFHQWWYFKVAGVSVLSLKRNALLQISNFIYVKSLNNTRPNNLFAKPQSVVGKFKVIYLDLPKFWVHGKCVWKAFEVKFF